MVHPNNETTKMGQAGLCTAPPQTDSPLNSGLDSYPQELISNGSSNDIIATVSALLENKADVKTEDLLLKLRSLINENLELKDTITQNNLALRQQMNLLVQWHQQVENQQRHFREELNNAHKQSNSLQQENTLLKSTLTGLKNSNPGSPKFQELDNMIQELYQQLNATERKLQVTLEEKDSISSQRTKLEGELTLLRCDLAATKSEFERLKLQRQELLSTAKELRERLQTREMQLGREKNQNISEDVEKVYKTLQKEREAAGVLFQELEEARSQVEHLESELKTARAETQKYKSKYQISRNENSPPLSPSLDSKLNDSDVRKWKDEAALLREEVETLEAALEEERKRTNEERATLNRIQGENLRLKKEINENRDRSEKSHYSDQYYQTKIKSIQEMHDEATAKLISYEELVGSKNEEIARLKKDLGQTKAQLMEMKSEGETIAVLRAQVEVYQSDFRAEREAREAMASDREKLREDLRHLQMRNTQLMDELEAYQRRHFSQGQGPSSRSASEEPKDTKDFYLNPENIWDKLSNSSDKKVEDKKEENPEVDENLLYCPKCSKSFSELRPLEEHVNRCLDED
ncbi:UNVERIFIED_CONTAM: hypothetical protein RMT77_007456 [Armadillidium vulgare]